MPFALWRRIEDATSKQDERFADWPVLAQFAGIYKALGRMGIGQAEADEMELWVIGAVLGVDEPDVENDVERGPHLAITQELLAERAKARAEGRPLPQPSVVGGAPPSTLRTG